MKFPQRRLDARREDKSPIWLIVLCDMMTILMLFFLMMFSYTYQPELKERFVKTFAVKEIITPPRKIVPEKTEEPPSEETAAALRRLFTENGLLDTVEILETESAVRVRLRESVLFHTARARLNPKARRPLAVLAEALQAIPNEIIVEGHTDDVPITKAKFRSNWELSVARSYSVMVRLMGEGVTPERLVAAGYGQYHPASPNDSPENRSHNRRVEIVILRSATKG